MAERRTRYARDPLGLKRALSDRLLPGLVAAMALLAALALAGSRGAEALQQRWQHGAAAAVTVQLPPEQSGRIDEAIALLREMPEVAEAAPVDSARMRELLRPWLGEVPSLPLPAVLELRMRNLALDPAPVAQRLAEAIPGAELEAHGIWVARLAALARSVQGVALAVLALVVAVAVAVVAVATRAGLAARRQAIEILHDLGATQGDIAGRFARRIGLLAGGGALAGAALSVPTLAALSSIAAPLAGGEVAPWSALPWLDLALLPPFAGLIGWATAQLSVRRWLQRLP
ncbi:cell division protein FtsX [Pseudoroseomonas cervicalis]|uniref:Efflux ABC transporter, permease protein n=1 Tax=Pseudoroseomonas cervicalis ATCC 49957 TaxID=525371 RepID=D5RT67_9PROT|nr:FtsX-like permease family protein [Pseudoroseomonas cervicalis]EFH09500.1 efflux ABC transporter, permease protein [Pseudoroseomonas cervicalis ATCC 49957]